MSGRPFKKQVLLIEDEEILADLITQKLELSGFEVTHYTDGEKGLAAAKELKYDIILLDILLPGKNGYEIMRALTEEGIAPRLPVIIISNSGQEIQIKKLKELGIKDYIIKVNFDPGEVLEKVNEVLGLASSEKKPDTPNSEQKVTEKGTETTETHKDANKHVLLVEDDPFLSKMLLRKLENHFNVYHAADTEQAEAIMNSHPVDLICLDIMLPGKDGLTFLKEIKLEDTYKNIPVLILSNLGQEDEIERGMKNGAAGYLVKANSSPDEIVKQVKDLSNK